MDIKTIALLLLIGRLTAFVFMGLVLSKQLKLFKATLPDSLRRVQKVLFFIALVIFVGQFIPIMIDVLTIIDSLSQKRGSPSVVGVAYAFSNNITSILASLFIWLLYRLAARTKITADDLATLLQADVDEAKKK